jgi:hypothetical protein
LPHLFLHKKHNSPSPKRINCGRQIHLLFILYNERNLISFGRVFGFLGFLKPMESKIALAFKPRADANYPIYKVIKN